MSAPASLLRAADAPATRQDVSRLFARAAFGATAADLDRWAGQPYEAAVDHLLNVPALDSRAPAPDDAERLVLENDVVEDLAGLYNGVRHAGQWWVERMRTTQYPLEERMVLFWHDHFATAYLDPYPDVRLLVLQNQTMRRHALGNFQSMVADMTVDPAMLYWLNGNENAVGKPNENFARELFELFTLGVVPQRYTEQDIREAARALTGWAAEGATKRVTFNANRHDTGTKTVLGTTFGNLGNQEYLKVIDIALAQDVAPKFLAYKLVLNFGYFPATGDTFQDPDPLIDKVAATLRGSNWNVKDAMRTLLLSEEFRAADPAKQLVRQPIDIVASACKAIGVSARSANVSTLLERMGQLPFDPPNVGGWPVQKEWLSPVTTLARYDWGVTAFNLTTLPTGILGSGVGAQLPPSNDLDAWARQFGLAGLSANTRAVIRDYVAAKAGAPENEKRAGVLILLVSSPDWMVI
ncbi:MAG TPA: DUF1800 domain-containing protein [Actinomycetota bacterium]|nr:DUF1800 domain-containing protein [Actinomycetota bacterium]